MLFGIIASLVIHNVSFGVISYEEFGLELERLSRREKRRIEDAIKHLGCETYGTRMSGGSRVTVYRPTEEYLISLSNYRMLIRDNISLDREEF